MEKDCGGGFRRRWKVTEGRFRWRRYLLGVEAETAVNLHLHSHWRNQTRTRWITLELLGCEVNGIFDSWFAIRAPSALRQAHGREKSRRAAFPL
jgi:hypothetical protein